MRRLPASIVALTATVVVAGCAADRQVVDLPTEDGPTVVDQSPAGGELELPDEEGSEDGVPPGDEIGTEDGEE